MNKIEITSDGARLIACIFGEKQDFLLLHAGGENKEVWLPVQKYLASVGLGTAALDQRGHGESFGSVDEPIERFAKDIRQLHAACTGTRILVGASLGGFASILALEDQELQSSLDGLVLVDVVPAPDPDHTRKFLSVTAPRLAETYLVDDILQKERLLSQAVSRIKIPILLVRAGTTGPMSDNDVRRLRELCPQLVVEQIDSAGHLIARDAPRALADILLRFEQSIATSSENLLFGKAENVGQGT